ncbi:Hypothetical predicted protein [Prunus dulcis]|uniref:Uncharacterized protein n=1 Tax=Prunus dulcis TaxID=3755 RepID=A0A5E4FMP4_PRUDU|nr:Hypothetical predicted protein [Prunus dulcis]
MKLRVFLLVIGSLKAVKKVSIGRPGRLRASTRLKEVSVFENLSTLIKRCLPNKGGVFWNFPIPLLHKCLKLSIFQSLIFCMLKGVRHLFFPSSPYYGVVNSSPIVFDGVSVFLFLLSTVMEASMKALSSTENETFPLLSRPQHSPYP